MIELLKEQSPKITQGKIQHFLRYVPFIQSLKYRMLIGFALLLLSVAIAGIIFGEKHIS